MNARRFPRRLPTLFLSALVVMVHLSCTDSGVLPRVKAGGQESPNTVLLVTIDTWRRDANGFLGDAASSPTPFLDGMAAQGLVAVNAVAPAPLTGPSHWSMLTGRWPWRDGLRVNGDSPTDPPFHLAEALRAADFETGAFVSCAVLDRRFGFDRGFDHFDDEVDRGGGLDISWAQRRGDQTVQAALSWIGTHPPSTPLFIWVHLFDPHFPYASPIGPHGSGDRARYLGEVAFADQQVAALAAGLGSLGRPWKGAFWVVLADHGEALGEHGEPTHGYLLHSATTSIPFVVFGPGVAPGRQMALTSTVDVPVTVLAGIGLPLPAGDGVDVVSAQPGDRQVPLESLEGLRSFGLPAAVGVRDPFRLWEASPEDHLWDLRDDPLENRDVAAERPDEVRELREAWRLFGVPDSRVEEGLDDEEVLDLQALGYLVEGIEARRDQSVRQFVRVDLQMHADVMTAQRAGEYERAETAALAFLERHPDSQAMWGEAGFIAVQLGDWQVAESRFRRSLDIDSSNAETWLNLANVLLLTKRPDEAIQAYDVVLSFDPRDASALYNRGAALVELGRADEAMTSWRRFLESHPSHSQAAQVRRRLATLP